MKNKLVIILLLVSITSFGQSRVDITTDLNTVFVCIDSLSYRELFNNTYIKDTLFLCKEQEITTEKETYQGKYLIGESAVIEFFQPNNSAHIGDHYGDWGIELKTRQIKALDSLRKIAAKHHIKIDTSLENLVLDTVSIPWYKTISLKTEKNELTVQEYQKEFLRLGGISEEDIETPMLYKEFISKVSNGEVYSRQFSKIQSISLLVNKDLLKLLKQFAIINSLIRAHNSFSGNDFSIEYHVMKHIPQFTIREIVIELINAQPARRIEISPGLIVTVAGKVCKFTFYRLSGNLH